MPSHLKSQHVNLTIPKYWRKRALCYAFLLKCYEDKPDSITPHQLRAQADMQFNHWNNKARIHDPHAPIAESEKFLMDLGFPSCSDEPIKQVPESGRRWSET